MTEESEQSGVHGLIGPSVMVTASEAFGPESAGALVDLIRDVARRHDLIVGLGDIAERSATATGVLVAAVLLEDEFSTLQIAALSDHDVAPTSVVTRLRTAPTVIDACNRRETVIDLAPAPTRWPADILAGLAELGCVGIAVVPPSTSDAGDGVLVALLGADPGDTGIAALAVLADLVAIVVRQADPQPDRVARLATLRRTFDERNTIEQAKGMLAERFDITPAVAWVRLRARSRELSVAVAEVARAVVERDDLGSGADWSQSVERHS